MERQGEVKRERVKTVENDDYNNVYTKGARNLLRLENETANEHIVKYLRSNIDKNRSKRCRLF